MSRRSVCVELCIEEAKKYDSRAKFFNGSRPAYQALLRRKLLDSACSHMTLSPRYSYVRWNTVSVLAEALKYSSRSEFKANCAGAYEFGLANGLLMRACAHMRDARGFWNIFELMAVAVKYDNQAEFIRSEKQAYNYAVKKKLVGIAMAHMAKSRVGWDKATVMAEAAKHQSRGAFQAALSGAYKHADQQGYLDEACAHMPLPEYGFSKEKSAVLYHLRITAADGLTLYKIGITNRTPEARIAGMGLHEGVTADVIGAIRFDNGRDARIAEKRLHRRLSASKYRGPVVMKNGNTELFTVNAFES